MGHTHILMTDLADEALGAVDEEVPLPVAEEHVLAEVPLQHRDQVLLRHLVLVGLPARVAPADALGGNGIGLFRPEKMAPILPQIPAQSAI